MAVRALQAYGMRTHPNSAMNVHPVCISVWHNYTECFMFPMCYMCQLSLCCTLMLLACQAKGQRVHCLAAARNFQGRPSVNHVLHDVLHDVPK